MRTRSACARSASASWRATPRTTSTSTGTTTTRTLTCAPPQTALPARARQPGPSARRAAPADRRPRRSGAGLGVGRRGDVEEAQDEAPQHTDAGREAAGRQPEQELHRGPPQPSGPSPPAPAPRPASPGRRAPARSPPRLPSPPAAARDHGVRQVPQARAELPVRHDGATPPPAPPLLRGVWRGWPLHPPAGRRQVRPRVSLPPAHPCQAPQPAVCPRRLCFKSSEGRKCYEIYTETKGAHSLTASVRHSFLTVRLACGAARFGYGR